MWWWIQYNLNVKAFHVTKQFVLLMLVIISMKFANFSGYLLVMVEKRHLKVIANSGAAILSFFRDWSFNIGLLLMIDMHSIPEVHLCLYFHISYVFMFTGKCTWCCKMTGLFLLDSRVTIFPWPPFLMERWLWMWCCFHCCQQHLPSTTNLWTLGLWQLALGSFLDHAPMKLLFQVKFIQV